MTLNVLQYVIYIFSDKFTKTMYTRYLNNDNKKLHFYIVIIVLRSKLPTFR